ncbi:hypothetical protein E4U13_005830 [Claviceps humidiphila]|uniref:Uncharacterized protein n=1 Tax=Claviceps humidiphila TaxID=1294629 RepID=A0A9P7PUP6_9HYPO|nr:hypothetical protein E4U13_005830 [Claviceps humidiphila]
MASPPGTNVTPLQARETRKRALSMSTAHDLAVDDPQNHKKIQQPVASVDTRCSLSSRPSLQNLPLELLESIFLYSTNFALPRSSPLLGAKLSGKATLLRLFMVGFHDTWDRRFGIPVEEAQVSNFPKLPDNDISLQFDLLSMPWVDIDFILEAQQIWADKYARGRCYRHYVTEGLGTQDLYEKNVHARDRYLQHVHQHQEESWTFDARACFKADYERALQFPPAMEKFSLNSLWGSADVHTKVRIPVDLITGPWDEEKKRRLFWLVRAGAYVMDPRTKDSWKVRLAGLEATVITPEKPDPLVLKCLITPIIWIGLPPDATHNRIVMMCRRIARGVDTQDMIQILQFLVRAMHCDLKFMTDYGDEDEDADFDKDDEFYDKLYNELVEEGVEYEGWGSS